VVPPRIGMHGNLKATDASLYGCVAKRAPTRLRPPECPPSALQCARHSANAPVSLAPTNRRSRSSPRAGQGSDALERAYQLARNTIRLAHDHCPKTRPRGEI
jgi:hypothetical protein